jgi:tight adherence protein B
VRRPPGLALAGVLATGLLYLGHGALAADESELPIERIDAGEFPIVSLTVTPPETLRGSIPDAVALTENGAGRPATVRLLADQPLEVVLVMDTSGSMRGEALDAAVGAAISFVDEMPETTRMAVMGFADDPTVIQEFTSDRDLVRSALRTLIAGGETALFDAVRSSLEAFDRGSENPRFVVLLSDGGDTVSRSTLDDTVEDLAASGVAFYAVALDTDESDSAVLEQLAEAATGRVVAAEDPAALQDVYRGVASELANQLVISYETPAGGTVEVSIRIERAGEVAIGTVTFDLPVIAAPTTTTTTTRAAAAPYVAPTTTTTQAPPVSTYVGTGAGVFGARWVLALGIGALSVAALVVFGLGLVPAERRRSSTLAVHQGPFREAGGWLTRATLRARSLADAVLTRGGRETGLNAALDAAGVELAAGEFVVLSASAGIISAAIALALLGPVQAAVIGLIALLAPRAVIMQLRDRRRLRFADQLEGTLQLLAGSLRAGYGLAQALNTVAAEANSPTREEFGRVIVETRLGRDLVESLRGIADRMASEDFTWTTEAVDIQRSVGGDLASILDTVSETIRERNQIKRHIRALSAEGRISAYVLIALPFVIAAFILLVAPDFLSPLFETIAGRIALMVGAVLMVVGVIWIRRLVRLVF